jgi:rhamnulokinase
MAARRLLALDLGAESGRALLGRFTGERLELETIRRFPNEPVRLGGILYWDFPRLFGEVLAGIRGAGEGLDALGVDTWGVDFGLLDERGQLLGNPVHYRDRRTEGMMEAAWRRVPKAEIFASTGIQFMPINSLYQLLAMVQAGDPRLGAARTLLMMPDLFHRFLCGSLASELTDATTSQCFDPVRHAWAWNLLERLEIPRGMFPDVVEPGTVLGRLTPDVVAEVGPGASSAVVIAPATHDTASAVAAVPYRPGSRAAYISSGTWALVGVEVPEPVLSPGALACNLTNEGGVDGTFRLLRNVMGLWLLQECRRAWSRQSHAPDYAELVDLAARARPFAAVIDPDDQRFLRSGDMPALIRAFCEETGQTPPDEPGQVVRVVLESLALRFRWVLHHLEQVTGTPLDTVHVVGGGARNPLLCQLTADATGLLVLAGPVEATAAGNLLLQARALGDLSSLTEGRDLVRHSFPLDPYDPSPDRGQWDAAYARFQAVIQ